MQAQIFPDFTRSDQQRIKGILTPQQVLVGMTIILPLMLAAQVSALLCVPPVLLAYGVLVFWAVAPAQGSVKAMHHLYRLVALWASRTVEQHNAFTHVALAAPAPVRLRMDDEDGSVMLSAEVDLPTNPAGGRP
jgi:hypothetical protein